MQCIVAESWYSFLSCFLEEWTSGWYVDFAVELSLTLYTICNFMIIVRGEFSSLYMFILLLVSTVIPFISF